MRAKNHLRTLAFTVGASCVSAPVGATLTEAYDLFALGTPCRLDGTGSGSITSDTCVLDRGGSFRVDASARASYASVGSSARVVYEDVLAAESRPLGRASASSVAQDVVTIGSSTLDGSGTYELRYDIALSGATSTLAGDGTVATSSGVLSVAVEQRDGTGASDVARIERREDSRTGASENLDRTGSLLIELGIPLRVRVRLDAEATVWESGPDPWSASSLATFANTGGITGFALFDPDTGLEVRDWSLTSESGRFGFYEPDGVESVPEPEVLALLAAACVPLVAVPRRRRAFRSRREAA